MKVLKRLFCLSVLCSVLTATAAAAASDSAGNRFDIAGNVIADQTVNGDYVAFGQSVKLESGVAGDIIAGGRTVVITDEGGRCKTFLLQGRILQCTHEVSGTCMLRVLTSR